MLFWGCPHYDHQVGSIAKYSADLPIIQEIFLSMRGLLKIHQPALVITVNDVAAPVLEALQLATARAEANTTIVRLPRTAVPYALWMADLKSSALQCKFGSSFPSSRSYCI